MSDLVARAEAAWLPWIRWRADVPHEAIWREFQGVWHRAVAHRPHESTGWYSLTLHGARPDWTEAIDQYEGYEHVKDVEGPYDWTEIAHACPVTTSFLKSLPVGSPGTELEFAL